MKYDSVDDAQLYLASSILRHKDDFIYVSNVRSMTNVDCWSIKKRKEVTLKLTDIDYSTINLGYYYDRELGKLLYLERMPSRTWRQGLTSNNVVARGGRRFHLPNVTSRAMQDLLVPKYLKFKPALEEAVMKRREVAFNRRFSIDSDSILRYKTKPIGEYRNEEFKLLHSCAYLKELLEKSV